MSARDLSVPCDCTNKTITFFFFLTISVIFVIILSSPFFPRSLLQNNSHAHYSSKCKKTRSIPMCLGFQGLSIELKSNLSTSAVMKLILFHRRNGQNNRLEDFWKGRFAHWFAPAHLEKIYLKSQTLLLFSLTPQCPISFQYLIDPCEISPPHRLGIAVRNNAVPPPQVLSSVYFLTAIQSR